MKDISLISQKQKEQGFSSKGSSRRSVEKTGRGMKLVGGLGIIVILIGAGLFFWNQTLENQVQALEDERMNVIAERDAKLESRVNTLSSVLGAYKELLTQHRNWSRIFDLIEDRTIPVITFTAFDGQYIESEIELEGLSPNYRSIAEQIRAFEETEQFVSVTVREINLNEQGEVEFDMIVTFKKDIVTGAPVIK